MRSVVLLSVICWTVSVLGQSKVKISRDGGYSNIVIKFDSDVNQHFCAQYIRRLQEMITEASVVLDRGVRGVTGGAGAHFKQVTIVIPAHWEESHCGLRVVEAVGGIAYQTADIQVQAESLLSPSAPYTGHSLGCGQPGDRITIPEIFFTDWNSTLDRFVSPAKTFVKEWAKFRYGVFDEHGFTGDTLYPNFYKVQGKFLPTGSSNLPVKGVWVSRDGAGECEDPSTGLCQFVAQGENDEVTCSLGFMPGLQSVVDWCGPGEVKIAMAPTKHNVLCSGRTAAEIIRSHPDFSSAESSERLQLSLMPGFDIVREPNTKYVLLIETSADMVDSWKWTRKAVQNLVRYQLSEETSVAIVTFNSEAQLESDLVKLSTGTERARLADTVPDSANKLGSTSHACVSCAVQLSVGRLLNGNMAGANIIIVTSGHYSDTEIDPDLLDQLKISVVSVRPDLETDSQTYRHMADRSGGLYTSVTTAGQLDLYTQIIENLGQVIARDSQHGHVYPVTLHQRHVTSGDGVSTDGTFSIDGDLGRDTEFGIYVEDDEDHQIKSVTFRDSENNIYGPFSSMSSVYDSVNLKTINFNVGETPPFDRHHGTVWRYSIDWYTSSRARDNVVVVRSRPRDHKVIRVKSWTNMRDMNNIISGTNLMAIFVEVTFGDSPVINADIEANITVRMNNGSVVRVNNLTLLDNGYGEPDTVQSDGIYSGVVTQYPAAGQYSVSVRARSGPGGASVITSSLEDGQACCGSMVPLSQDNTASTGSFSRLADPLRVEVSEVRLGEDTITPAKIGDLSIQVSSPGNGSQLILQWTAPGGDFNDGSVVTYRFVFSHNIEELLNPGGTPPALDGLKRTDRAGQRVRHVINFPFYNQDYYIGLAASDKRGNRGAMSNVVLVNIPAPQDSEDYETGISDAVGRNVSTNWILIGAVAGGLASLLLILILIVCIFKCCRKSKSRFSKDKFAKNLKSSGVKVEFPSPAQSETTDTSSYESEQHHHHQQQHQPSGQPGHSSTSFAANLTPTYWSASQLLGQHELKQGEARQEYRPDYRQNNIGYNPGYHAGYNTGYSQYDNHNNYGYYHDQQDQYQDYYGTAGRRLSSASAAEIYGHFDDPEVHPVDLRNITQV